MQDSKFKIICSYIRFDNWGAIICNIKLYNSENYLRGCVLFRKKNVSLRAMFN